LLKTYLLSALISLAICVITAIILIPLLKKLKAGQPILSYVKEHDEKKGTPTMGGLFFVLSTAITFLIFGGVKSRIAVVVLTLGVAFMFVGFIDDFIKVKYLKNEGLKAYQKIIFQLGIAVLAGAFAYYNGLTVFYLPFTRGFIDLKILTIPVVALVFIAITNSVNLTDGLDGLAGSVSVSYLIVLSVLIYAQITIFSDKYLQTDEYESLILLSSCLVGGLIGFLIFNVNPAKVFMGDTGSLSLGGFIGGVSVFSSNSFFIPIIGIMFVLSSISVIIQVIVFKLRRKRVFLMAPLHHHFQHKGYSECKISFCYVVVTFVFGILSLLTYL